MNSKIILARGIKVDREYSNVLSYTEQQMVNLCLSNQISQADDYSFIRQNRNSISTHFTYSQCLQANYIAFQNTDYSGKWFFAWIDDVIYKSNGTTEIQYTIDYWSTWFDYWQKKPCFVVREHVNDDTIGLHTIPENLSVGEVTTESIDEYNGFSDCYIAVSTTYEPASSKYKDNEGNWQSVNTYPGARLYNGQVFGDAVFLFDSIVQFIMFLEVVNTDTHTGDISNVYIVPKNLFDVASDLIQHRGYYSLDAEHSVPFDYYTPKQKNEIERDSKVISKTHNFNNITIKNNKCYTYPYNYLYITNNVGNENILKYEDFNTQDITFELEFAISVGCTGRMIPKNYKNINSNYNESLIVAKFPTCSWSSDAYTNWLSQNAVNISTQITNMGVETASSIGALATGNVGGAVSGLISTSNSVASLIGQFYQASLLPAIKQGTNNADINYLANKNKIQFYHMRAKNEYLEIIDNYFSRFGYKINTIKLPNITGRTHWNYVEISSTEEVGYGDVPSNAMDAINNACRKGVTIWHNHTTLGDYSLDNSIV